MHPLASMGWLVTLQMQLGANKAQRSGNGMQHDESRHAGRTRIGAEAHLRFPGRVGDCHVPVS